MEARWCVVFTGGSGLTVLIGDGPAAVAAHRRREASAVRLGVRNSAPRLAGPSTEYRDLEAAMRHVWQGQRLSGVPQRASVCALGGGRRADKSNRKRNGWIEISI
jgi:hypothetical protein